MSDTNLRYLQKRLAFHGRSTAALRNFNGWTPEKLFKVLRHHDDTDHGISNAETWLRDDFDFLLSFYGVVEIALMIGFIEKVSPGFVQKHLPVLCNPAVRQYYDWHYPLDLPRRLRERLQSGISYNVPASRALNDAFYEFIETVLLIESDKDLESFLWCLDGGARKMGNKWFDIDTLVDCLEDPKLLAFAVQTPPRNRNVRDRALNGFCKFIQFCERFTSLLERLKEQPQVAEAMWLAHAYWLRKMSGALGDNLNAAVYSLVKWKVPAAGKGALRARAKELTTMFSQLGTPPLTNWKLGRPPDPVPVVNVTDTKALLAKIKANLQKISEVQTKRISAVKEATAQNIEILLTEMEETQKAKTTISGEETVSGK